MPTVIIPPTDVSPNTGTGSEVLSNSPTLVTPNIGAATGTSLALTGNVTASDLILGTSGPSAKSSINARAARQGLVFDGTAGAAVTIPAFGTADFTVAIWLRLNSAQTHSFCDANNGLLIDAAADGSFRIYNRAASSQIYGAPASTLTTNKNYLLCYSRSGSGAVYLNGVALQTGISDSVSYTASISAIGSNYAGNYPINGFLAPFVYNRALSASEVVSLFEAGVPAAADYNTASNTAVYSTNFSTSTGWTAEAGWSISAGVATLSGTSAGGLYRSANSAFVPNARYRLTFTVASYSSGGVKPWVQIGSSRVYGTTRSANGTYTEEIVAPSTTGSSYIGFDASTSSSCSLNVDDFSYYNAGLLLAPDAGQAGGGLTWYDTSGNAANITLPASGVAWAVPTSGKMATSLNVNAAASLFASTSNSTSISDVDTTAALISKGSGTPRLYLGNDNSANRPFLQAGVGGGALFMILQPYGGNLLIGSQTDNALGRLQVSGAFTTTEAGGTGLFGFFGGSSLIAGTLGAQSFNLRTNNTTALTLDSSQHTIAAATVRTGEYYVTGLPTGAAATRGMRAFVIDATATTYASIVAGGGSNKVPVFYDGTNWCIG